VKINISNPDLLWLLLQYKKTRKKKSSPILVKDWVGKDALKYMQREREAVNVYRVSNYLDDENIISDVTDYFIKTRSLPEYIRICSRIKRNITDTKYVGGMVGIYNPSITQRLNGFKRND
jgi:hypothetical protein